MRTPPAPCRSPVHGLDHGERVAARGQVPVDALRPAAFPASRTYRAPAVPQRRDRLRPALAVERVGGAQHRDGSARLPERLGDLGRGLRRPGLRRLDARPPAGGCGRSPPARCRRPAARGWRGTRADGRRSRRAAASERSRNASYGSAGRYRGSPPAGGSGSGRRVTAGSARSANSLTPVIGAFRRAAAVRRRSRTSPTRSATRPASSAATAPPAASISWKNAHAARASSAVSDSTNQEPPAGSITRARCASCTSSDWVLRAIRRENGPRRRRSPRRTGPR